MPQFIQDVPVYAGSHFIPFVHKDYDHHKCSICGEWFGSCNKDKKYMLSNHIVEDHGEVIAFMALKGLSLDKNIICHYPGYW